ncbi:MAG: hypothetical protein Q7S55_03865 [Nanoarchaeota archaeon]|nr:hypothetical protein [Nanoarchaeota archaeon]
MKNLRKEDLPRKVAEELKLDEITEVFWSEDREKYVSADNRPMLSLAFAGVGLVTVSYDTEVRKSDHYLLKDDPYSAERTGKIQLVGSTMKRPSHATHYCLGPKASSSLVTSGERKCGDSEDYFPVVYLYPNEFTPFKKD